MSDNKRTKFTLEEPLDIFLPPEVLRSEAHLNSLFGYHQAYDRSTRETDDFWLDFARQLFFQVDSGRGLEYNFDVHKGPIYTHFMAGSKTNIAFNCLERIIESGKGDKLAYNWIGNMPENKRTLTYRELHNQVVDCSAMLRSKGVRKGDVVAIYMPMIPEIVVAMLACARIGAPHSVVFGGFSAESLSQRILQAKARLLITADAAFRGSKLVPLKSIADQAISLCKHEGHSVDCQIVVEHLKRVTVPNQSATSSVSWQPIDCRWDDEMEKCKGQDSPVEWMDAEDPLFVLYTSGSTGIPKGILHTTAGYMTYAYATTKYVFDAHSDDVFWCTADCGWITGHTYVVYGPLLNGLTSVLFEGIPTYPDPSRNWQIVEQHKVTKIYTSPTAIRCLMGFGNDFVKSHDRSSLKVIATVGEPINPSAWLWLNDVVGEGRAAIVDTYWQTETGGHVLAPLPGAYVF